MVPQAHLFRVQRLERLADGALLTARGQDFQVVALDFDRSARNLALADLGHRQPQAHRKHADEQGDHGEDQGNPAPAQAVEGHLRQGKTAHGQDAREDPQYPTEETAQQGDPDRMPARTPIPDSTDPIARLVRAVNSAASSSPNATVWPPGQPAADGDRFVAQQRHRPGLAGDDDRPIGEDHRR